MSSVRSEAPVLTVPRLAVNVLRCGDVRHGLSGARVTVTFDLPDPIVEHRAYRIPCDTLTSREFDEVVGVPQLTHTSKGSCGDAFHYRMSIWRPAVHAGAP